MIVTGHHFETDEFAEDQIIGNKNKKRLLKKAPDAPKRFKSAYICYVMEMMDEIKSEQSGDIKVKIYDQYGGSSDVVDCINSL